MKIETIKISGNGWLINGSTHVPSNENNRHYEIIQKWINEGNIPAPEYTELELSDQTAENDYQKWKTELEKQKDKDLRAEYKKEKGL